jgi:hypothetical protein
MIAAIVSRSAWISRPTPTASTVTSATPPSASLGARVAPTQTDAYVNSVIHASPSPNEVATAITSIITGIG